MASEFPGNVPECLKLFVGFGNAPKRLMEKVPWHLKTFFDLFKRFVI